MFKTLDDVKAFLGEDSTMEEVWALVEILPYYNLEFID